MRMQPIEVDVPSSLRAGGLENRAGAGLHAVDEHKVLLRLAQRLGHRAHQARDALVPVFSSTDTTASLSAFAQALSMGEGTAR